MEEKNRYIYTKIDGYYWIKDTETNENYCVDKKIVNLLNQQDKRIKELEEENQRLKQQLSDEEKAHDLCIDHFNEECEKLRKQIKFESEARERFKQSQNQKAIKVLEAIRRYLDYQVRTSKFSYNEYVDFVNLVFSSQIDILSCKQNDKRN